MTINIHNVVFSYPDVPDAPILDIPSWSVCPGERVFIHGPSGGGKSTLLNLISGALVPERGEISVLDSRLDSMPAGKRDLFRARHIGYVFQQFNLIPYLNAVENIQLARYFSKKSKNPLQDIQQLLKRLNISENNWRKASSQLSIGQQQRVAIGRALINQPEILIADEPTSSLDQNNRDSFMSLLMDIVEEHEITLIVVSHDMLLSQYFTRVESLSDISRGVSG